VFAGLPRWAPTTARALRRLCDYVTRPASARLSLAKGSPDALLLPLPPQPDATTHAPLRARDVVARLVAATPAEPAVSVRAFGVLAPTRGASTGGSATAASSSSRRCRAAERRRLPRTSRPGAPREPRCVRCDVALAALAVEAASDPPPRGT
jgi:hypothetical protein